MPSEQTLMLELAEKLWKNYFSAKVDEKLKGRPVQKRAVVTVAAANGLIGVQFPFDDATHYLPYVSLCSSLAVGAQCTVEYIGGSANNAVIVQNGSFTL